MCAARDGVVDREEELKGDGLYGSSTSDPILPAALAELVGTFILVFGGTAVAVGAILSLPTAPAGPRPSSLPPIRRRASAICRRSCWRSLSPSSSSSWWSPSRPTRGRR